MCQIYINVLFQHNFNVLESHDGHFRGHKNIVSLRGNRGIWKCMGIICTSAQLNLDPFYKGTRDSSPFSCFLCQTQLDDHIKQTEIHLLEGDVKQITIGDAGVKE